LSLARRRSAAQLLSPPGHDRRTERERKQRNDAERPCRPQVGNSHDPFTAGHGAAGCVQEGDLHRADNLDLESREIRGLSGLALDHFVPEGFAGLLLDAVRPARDGLRTRGARNLEPASAQGLCVLPPPAVRPALRALRIGEVRIRELVVLARGERLEIQDLIWPRINRRRRASRYCAVASRYRSLASRNAR